MIQTEKLYSHSCTCCGHFWNDNIPFALSCPKCQDGKITSYQSIDRKVDHQHIDVCVNCPNDPRNGGTGVCNCALPQMANPTMC